MLKRSNRATSNDLATIGRGRVIRTKHLLFSYTPAPQGQKSKIACSVAKKVAKLAVDRNTLKRQCRAALEEYLPLPHTPVVGIVRIMDSTTMSSDFKIEIKEIFDQLQE